MAVAVTIRWADMKAFLEPQGFQEIPIPGTKERVLSKFVDKDLCLRVYTSIVGDSSRDIGEDAIRTVLVTKIDGEVKLIGSDKRVHRVAGWRKNLQDRLDNWREQLGPACPKCGRVTVLRTSRKGPFWGCSAYPKCYSITPFVKPVKKAPRSLAAAVDSLRDSDEVPVQRWGSPVVSEADWIRETGNEEFYGEDDSDERELEANGL